MNIDWITREVITAIKNRFHLSAIDDKCIEVLGIKYKSLDKHKKDELCQLILIEEYYNEWGNELIIKQQYNVMKIKEQLALQEQQNQAYMEAINLRFIEVFGDRYQELPIYKRNAICQMKLRDETEECSDNELYHQYNNIITVANL